MSEEPIGVRSCKGEPNHADFFSKTTFSAKSHLFEDFKLEWNYMDRHNVLFNLYSFDALRSKLIHSPTLRLINCDFKYFLDDR